MNHVAHLNRYYTFTVLQKPIERHIIGWLGSVSSRSHVSANVMSPDRHDNQAIFHIGVSCSRMFRWRFFKYFRGMCFGYYFELFIISARSNGYRKQLVCILPTKPRLWQSTLFEAVFPLKLVTCTWRLCAIFDRRLIWAPHIDQLFWFHARRSCRCSYAYRARVPAVSDTGSIQFGVGVPRLWLSILVVFE